MIIDSSAVNTAAAREYQSVRKVTEKAYAWVGDRRPSQQGEQDPAVALDIRRESDERLKQFSLDLKEQINASKAKHVPSQMNKVPMTKDELRLTMLEMFMEKLMGRPFRFKRLDMQAMSSSQQQSLSLSAGSMSGIRSAGNEGWGLEYDKSEFQYESEKVAYSAQGVVKTVDGKTINVDIQLLMSREFSSYTRESLRLGDAAEKKLCDPLVINFGGASATLTQEKYLFDLTCDGNKESISFTGQGSGFLALDKDGDGVIKDGSYLFGAQSGDGFGDLRTYDKDENGWIDEADEIFSKLKVWTKDEEGKDVLYSLADLGVGAIYLGNVDTQFSVNGANNTGLGQIASTSFYLKENGGAGTIQHVDLYV